MTTTLLFMMIHGIQGQHLECVVVIPTPGESTWGFYLAPMRTSPMIMICLDRPQIETPPQPCSSSSSSSLKIPF
jgi:hypothetical protein